MSLLLEAPSRQIITLYLIWFRLIALIYAIYSILLSPRYASASSLIVVVIYTALILSFRSTVVEKVKQYPLLIVIDLLMLTFLELNSDAAVTPYYLYDFSPIILAGFLFRYRGAAIVAGAESILLSAADYATGYTPYVLAQHGGNISTVAFAYFFFAIATAYIADLLAKLEVATAAKSKIDSELGKAQKCLELSLLINQLSLREMQVLTLSSNGKTIDQIAEELSISKNTVKTYLKRIYEKLDVSSKQEAISRIMREETFVER